MAEYTLPLPTMGARATARPRAIPLWEKGFAVFGLYLCLDAGVRTLRILSGVEGPIQNTRTQADYADGSALTQILLFAVYLISVMLLSLHPPRAFAPKLLWFLPALAMFSVLWSDAPGISFRRAAALLGSSAFGLYLGTRYPRTTLLRLLLVVSVIAILSSLLLGVALPAYAIDGFGNWQGIFGYKNQLGRFMALSAVLWAVYAASFRRHRIPAVGFGVLSTLLVLLSHSATAVLTVAVLLIFLALVRLWRSHFIIAFPALVLVVIVGGYFAVRTGSNPGGLFDLLGRDSTLTGRTQLWSLVWQMIRERFWLGYGYGGFWLGYNGPSAPVWLATGWEPPSAHQGFLDLMLDLGVVGLIVFVPVLWGGLRHAFALARRGGALDTAFPLIFLVFFLISNITESWLVTHNALSWVLFVALAIQLQTWWQEERRPRARAAASTLGAVNNHDTAVRCPVLAAAQRERSMYQEGCSMSMSMSMSTPTSTSAQVTVSAIMPTYNSMAHLKEAIDSVLAQTFTDWELIIVDDGSTDRTPALLAQYTDPRIRVFELGENHGPARARNIALGFACGKYIAPCDSDDIFLPERFAKEVAYLESHPEIHVVTTQMLSFRQDETPQPHLLYPEDPAAIDRRFAKGKMAAPFGAAMIRSWCFDRFGPFCEDFWLGEDLEWFLRIRRNCNFRVLPEFLYLYRAKAGKPTLGKWLANARYDRYAVYRAAMFGTSAGSTVLPFDRFARRGKTLLALYTLDVLRFFNFRLRSNVAGRKLK